MTQGNDAPPQRVEEMFDRISAVYDGMNLAISGFQEPRWRRHLVEASGIGPGGRALDVACGTGKVTTDLYRAAQPGGSALGIDFSAGMIGVARARSSFDPGALAFRQGDALALPVEDDAFDAATIAFGMRNLADYRQGFAEMARAVRLGAPAGDSGRLGGGGGAAAPPPGPPRLDQPGRGQARQRHAGVALAHAEQAARGHGLARAERLAIGGQQQVEDQVTRVGRHRAGDITPGDILRQ